MRTIWYFVGLILSVMGLIILVSGVYSIIYPSEHKTVFGEYHPDIWWGLIMTAAGVIYLITSRGKRI